MTEEAELVYGVGSVSGDVLVGREVWTDGAGFIATEPSCDAMVREVKGAGDSAFVGWDGGKSLVSGVCKRPLKTTISSLDAAESAGEGLRIVIWARASVAAGLRGGVGEADGAGASGSRGGSRSRTVPSKQPALTKAMGMWRSFWVESKAEERWLLM